MSDDIILNTDYDDFVDEVEKGIKGGNTLIPVGLPKLNRHIGIGKGIYILIGGESGTGKTALTDEMFVLNPYDWYIRNKDKTDKKLRIIYRSMERSKTHKIAKWVCLRLWLKYNILVDVPTVLGWRVDKKPIPVEVYKKIKEARDYFEEMFDIVQVTDGAINPTGMYKQCKTISLSEGFLIKSNDKKIVKVDKYNPKGEVIKEFSNKHYKINKAGVKVYYEEVTIKGEVEKITHYYTKYYPDHPNSINVILGDHNGKWKNEKHDGMMLNDKQTLDKASEYYGELRDIYKWSPIAVNQFNRNIADTTRRVKLDLTPEKQDFKGSGNMYEDADFVCAVFNPHESGIREFKKYKIPQFNNQEGFNRFRSLHILKNSFGVDNIITGLNFIGENGHFNEVKRPTEMTTLDYSQAARPELNPPNPNLKVQQLI